MNMDKADELRKWHQYSPFYNMTVNLFLVVDALDEHEGNRRELLSILNRLAQSDGHPRFRLRLCLAGRPENVFKDALQSCPGFAIHEHTAKDIRTYTQARIETETGSGLTDDGKQDVLCLVETVVEKAHGVFLWVRLVVDEIIEGLCEGDTIAELEDLLSTIPTELEELYTRALRRTRYTSRRHQGHSPDEKRQAYVMFQIVISCIRPFKLTTLLAAVVFLTTGNGLQLCLAQVRKLSEDQMHRRLYSRSAGLLEAPRSIVQFMHQTVKEYMITGNGATVVSQEVRPDLRQSGNVLILRYMLSPLVPNGSNPGKLLVDRAASNSLDDINNSEDSDAGSAGTLDTINNSKDSDPESAGIDTDPANISADFLTLFSSLSHYLRVIETQEQTCVRDFLEPATLKASKIVRRILFTRALHCEHTEALVSLAPGFASEYWKTHIIRRNDRPEIQMLVYYVLNGLHLSFKESILLHRDKLRKEDIRCLRQAALVVKPESNPAESTMEDWKDYISEMLPNRTRMRSKAVNKTDCDTSQP